MNISQHLERALLSLLVVILLSGCNPYADLYPSRTPTTTASATPSRTATAARSQFDTQTPTPNICTVTTGVPAGNLNIRTGAGTSFPVIELLHEGQTLTLTGEERAGWVEVIADDLTGWINARYCKVKP